MARPNTLRIDQITRNLCLKVEQVGTDYYEVQDGERQRLLGITNICHLLPLEDIGVPISSSEDCVDGGV